MKYFNPFSLFQTKNFELVLLKHERNKLKGMYHTKITEGITSHG